MKKQHSFIIVGITDVSLSIFVPSKKSGVANAYVFQASGELVGFWAVLTLQVAILPLSKLLTFGTLIAA